MLHDWRYALWCLLLLLLSSALLHSSTVAASAPDKCTVCDRLTNAFERGLERTAKDNFGGGNTHWEESRLGSWAHSETRLVDIQERLCQDEGKEEAAACHALLEQVEEALEAWWFGDFRRSPVGSAAAAAASLRELLCVQRGLCCQRGAFGPECAACPACGPRGDCDGNGTRAGTGRCTCHYGYQGDLCDQCDSGRYLAEASPPLCLACHPACGVGGCIGGPSEADCRDCAAGYQPGGEPDSSGRVACVDVDECAADPPPCPGRYETCVNSPGSFACQCQAGYRRPDTGGDCEAEPSAAAAAGEESAETDGADAAKETDKEESAEEAAATESSVEKDEL